MAQVYSLNAVGYINITLVPGLSQISDQLYATNGQPNYISPTLDSQIGTNPGFAVGSGSRIYKYVQASESYDIWSVTAGTQAAYAAGGIPEKALSGVPASTVTLNPGEAIWFYNPAPTNLTLTFVGTVPATNSTTLGLTNVLSAGSTAGSGLQMVSSIVPVAGQLDTVLGVVPSTGDYAYVWQSGSQSYDIFKWTAGATWKVVVSTGLTAPSVSVGQGFWYQVNTASSTNNWTQYFGVNE
jgi:hypothetical protein